MGKAIDSTIYFPRLLLGRKVMSNLGSILKSRDITCWQRSIYIVEAMVFPVVMYGCESWTIKKAEHQRIAVFELLELEKTLQSLLDCNEIKLVNPKGNQSWIIIGRTDAEAETLVFWSSDENSQLTGKNPDAGKDWGQEEKGVKEKEMVGWYHWTNGHEFEQAPGNDEGQGSLACCSPRGHKESDTIESLNNNKINANKKPTNLNKS